MTKGTDAMWTPVSVSSSREILKSAEFVTLVSSKAIKYHEHSVPIKNRADAVQDVCDCQVEYKAIRDFKGKAMGEKVMVNYMDRDDWNNEQSFIYPHAAILFLKRINGR